MSNGGTVCVSKCKIPDADNDGQCGCPNKQYVSSNGKSCVKNCDGEFVSASGKECRIDCGMEDELINQEDYDNDQRCGCRKGFFKKLLSCDATKCVICYESKKFEIKDLFDFDKDGQCGC